MLRTEHVTHLLCSVTGSAQTPRALRNPSKDISTKDKGLKRKWRVVPRRLSSGAQAGQPLSQQPKTTKEHIRFPQELY